MHNLKRFKLYTIKSHCCQLNIGYYPYKTYYVIPMVTTREHTVVVGTQKLKIKESKNTNTKVITSQRKQQGRKKKSSYKISEHNEQNGNYKVFLVNNYFKYKWNF